jgi:MFS-type transporter involved in bile tolerance (Atg22 family)
MIANVVVLLAAGFWGWVADRFSRRVSMIVPGILSIPLAFWYLLTGD